MNIQRRTFLGGLLAAIATGNAFGRTLVDPRRIPLIEDHIKRILPEPEEGYQLVIVPGYGLPTIKVTAINPIEVPEPKYPSFSINMERDHFFSNSWSGTVTPVEHEPFRRCTMTATVEGDDTLVVREWMHKVIDAGSGFSMVPISGYKGTATLGQHGKDPLVKIEGLLPTSLEIGVDPKLTADVVFSFDYAQQNVL
jgi:hypothetical protein